MIAATTYLEKYFDCVEALPLDLQRHVTQLREVDRKTQDLLAEARRLQQELVECDGERKEDGKNCLARIQACLLQFRECGNEKLEITSQLLDTVDDYTQQLALRGKDLDNPRSAYDHPSPRYTHPPTHTTKGESTLATVTDGAAEKIASKRNSSTKRPRPSEKSHPHPPHTHPSPAQGGGEEEGGVREGGGRSRENSTTSSTGGTPGNGKPPKKKIKMKKKTTTASVTKDTSVFLPPSGQVPMPDLTSQPLDPDEPTYCFCNQVSFGEMIGCDNEECPIEWFHFQCVGLTSKPKGKWYCPRCSQERKGRNTK